MPQSASPIASPATGPWIMHMRWSKLLFMHWPVPVDSLRSFIPQTLEIDTFDSTAWLGIVPFKMSNVRPRGLPAFPGTSAFPELNVRTYVTHNGIPGVWFFSLDAANRLAVRVARRLWHLSYFDARMSAQADGEHIRYASTRTHKHAAAARLVMQYRPTGDVYFSDAGTLEHFLISRLSLYAADAGGRIYRGVIDHAPWPLQKAEAEIEVNEMTKQIGIELPGKPSLLHYSDTLDVKAWRIRRV